MLSPTIGTVTDRNDATGKIIYLGACLIAAVRLAREEQFSSAAEATLEEAIPKRKRQGKCRRLCQRKRQ
jgi:hypothetical protein